MQFCSKFVPEIDRYEIAWLPPHDRGSGRPGPLGLESRRPQSAPRKRLQTYLWVFEFRQNLRKYPRESSPLIPVPRPA